MREAHQIYDLRFAISDVCTETLIPATARDVSGGGLGCDGSPEAVDGGGLAGGGIGG